MRPSDSFVGRTLALDVLDRLRRDIVTCVLRPGARLRFDRLRSIYDASISTLREALVKLCAEGLVIGQGQRGFTVAPANITDLLDLSRVRVLVEREVLACAIARGNEDWELRVLAAFQQLSRVASRANGLHRSTDPRWVAAHANFHEALSSACDSPILLELRRVLYARAERYRRLSARYAPAGLDKVDGHRAILEACINRNASLAASLIQQHIEHTTQNVLDFAPGFAAQHSEATQFPANVDS